MLPVFNLQMKAFSTPTLHRWRACIQASNPSNSYWESAKLHLSFFVPITSELIVLLKGKSDVKSWAYLSSLFFREYGPMNLYCFISSVFIHCIFPPDFKISLADEFTQIAQF